MLSAPSPSFDSSLPVAPAGPPAAAPASAAPAAPFDAVLAGLNPAAPSSLPGNPALPTGVSTGALRGCPQPPVGGEALSDDGAADGAEEPVSEDADPADPTTAGTSMAPVIAVPPPPPPAAAPVRAEAPAADDAASATEPKASAADEDFEGALPDSPGALYAGRETAAINVTHSHPTEAARRASRSYAANAGAPEGQGGHRRAAAGTEPANVLAPAVAPSEGDEAAAAFAEIAAATPPNPRLAYRFFRDAPEPRPVGQAPTSATAEPPALPAVEHAPRTEPPALPVEGRAPRTEPPALPAEGRAPRTEPPALPADGRAPRTEPPALPADGRATWTEAARIAGPAPTAPGEVSPPADEPLKKAAQSIVKEAVMPAMAALGIDPAKVRSTMEFVAPEPSALAPSPAAAEAEPEFATASTGALERVIQATDTSRTTERGAVNVRLDFGPAGPLSVQISLREGRVHALFRSDSSEVRDSLAHAWNHFVQSGDNAALPLAEPVMLPLRAAQPATGTGEATRFGDSPAQGGADGQAGRQTGAPEDQAAFAASRTLRRRTTPTAGPAPAAPTPVRSGPSNRLSAHA